MLFVQSLCLHDTGVRCDMLQTVCQPLLTDTLSAKLTVQIAKSFLKRPDTLMIMSSSLART